jgi:hypothetical protein
MSTPRRLRPVNPPTPVDHKCNIVVQAVLGGSVDYRVQAMTPLVGPGHGAVSLRLGRVVLVLEDRQAYEAVRRAWHEVEAVVDQALPELPPPAYRPRASRS